MEAWEEGEEIHHYHHLLCQSVSEKSGRVMMAAPKIDELLGTGVVTVCKPLGAEMVVVADWEQLGARVAVWEKSVAKAVTAAAAW